MEPSFTNNNPNSADGDQALGNSGALQSSLQILEQFQFSYLLHALRGESGTESILAAEDTAGSLLGTSPSSD